MIPYSFPDGAAVTVRHNAARVAEMWLGRYKYIYYATQVIFNFQFLIQLDDFLESNASFTPNESYVAFAFAEMEYRAILVKAMSILICFVLVRRFSFHLV